MKRLKKMWQVKFFKNYILLIIPLIILEIIFRTIEGLSIFSYPGLRILLGLNIIALLSSFILNFLPKLVAKIWNSLLILVISIYGIVELGFSNFLGVYASLQVNTQASAVASYVWDFLGSFKITFYLMLLPFIFLVLYYLFIDKRVDMDMPKKVCNIRNVTIDVFKFLLIIFTCFLYYATLRLDFMQNKVQAISSWDLFKKPSIPSLAVNEFGFIGFGILDIKEYFLPGAEHSLNIEYDPNSIILNKPSEDEVEVERVEQLAIDTEIWKNIIENEQNNTLNNINKYLISNKTTKTNEYTGMFKDKNLIVIMLESGSNIAINEEYYPNISKLYNEGWHWKNYYSPRNSCSTGNNEMSGMTGLYTIYNNCTANIYKKNTYFESIFNLFNAKGYATNSFHNNVDAYYSRTVIHKNMGSNNFYKVQDMKIKYGPNYGDWASDEEMMKYYLEKLDERDTTKPFMSWITTVTSHQPYTNSSTYNNLYFDSFPDTINKDVRRYMSKLKVVDNAIGMLIDGLEERGILDDTVIVLYCDHYPYGLATEKLNTVLDYDLDSDHNVDQVPFFIYNSTISKKEFKEYTSYVNVTPTLANLFGLEFDSRLYLGSDILSDEYNSLVIFADSSWKNDVAYYDATTNKIKYFTDLTYTDEEILAINEEVSLKLNMSSAIIKNNYFNYLNEKLNSASTSED